RVARRGQDGGADAGLQQADARSRPGDRAGQDERHRVRRVDLAVERAVDGDGRGDRAEVAEGAAEVAEDAAADQVDRPVDERLADVRAVVVLDHGEPAAAVDRDRPGQRAAGAAGRDGHAAGAVLDVEDTGRNHDAAGIDAAAAAQVDVVGAGLGQGEAV